MQAEVGVLAQLGAQFQQTHVVIGPQRFGSRCQRTGREPGRPLQARRIDPARPGRFDQWLQVRTGNAAAWFS